MSPAADPIPEDDALPRRRRVGWLGRAVAVLAALGLIGSTVAALQRGSDSDPGVADDRFDGVVTEADLAGRTFVVVAIEGEGVVLPLAAQPPSLVFGRTHLELRTGCNGVIGDYEVVEEELRFAGGAMTTRLCSGTLGDQEGALLDLLEPPPGPGVERRGPAARMVGGAVLDLRLRDRRAWAVDVTEQPAVGGVTGGVASEVVLRLVQHAARGEWDAALQLRRGYAAEHQGDAGAARAELEQLLRDLPWLTTSTPALPLTLGVTPAWSWDEPDAAVTVLSEPDGDGVRHAAAFLVSPTGTPAIVRIPTSGGPALTPAAGATVSPGDRITLDGVPVEGGAVAHVNGVEVPVSIDHDAVTTSLVVPWWARGDIVLTLSEATPEASTATAAWYRVDP